MQLYIFLYPHGIPLSNPKPPPPRHGIEDNGKGSLGWVGDKGMGAADEAYQAIEESKRCGYSGSFLFIHTIYYTLHYSLSLDIYVVLPPRSLSHLRNVRNSSSLFDLSFSGTPSSIQRRPHSLYAADTKQDKARGLGVQGCLGGCPGSCPPSLHGPGPPWAWDHPLTYMGPPWSRILGPCYS